MTKYREQILLKIKISVPTKAPVENSLPLYVT